MELSVVVNSKHLKLIIPEDLIDIASDKFENYNTENVKWFIKNCNFTHKWSERRFNEFRIAFTFQRLQGHKI